MLPWMLFLVAFLLRYHTCFTRSFWGDEGLTLGFVEQWANVFRTGRLTIPENHTPIFDLACTFCYMAWPDPVVALRMPSFLAGVLACPVLFFMLKHRFGSVAAFATITVLAFYPLHVVFSQFGRAYALAFLFGSISLLYSWSAFERRSVGHLFFAGLFLFLGVFTHPTCIFILCAEIAFAVYLVFTTWNTADKRVLRSDRFGKTVAFLLLLGLLGGTAYSIWRLLIWGRLAATQAGNYSPASFLVGWGIDYGIPLCVVGGVAILYFLSRNDREGIFASITAAVPPCVLILLGFRHIPISPVYAFTCALGLPLVLGLFCKRLVESGGSRNSDASNASIASRTPNDSTVCFFAPFALAFACAFGPVMILLSDYKAYTLDFAPVMRWICTENTDHACLVITRSTTYPLHFAREHGRDAVYLTRDDSFEAVRDAVRDGRIVVLPLVWLASRTQGELDACDALGCPVYAIVETQRDGLSPEDFGTFLSTGGIDAPLEPEERLNRRLEREFRFVKRFGETRFDHRQRYLLLLRKK